MKTGLWVSIVVVASLLGFLLGYNISSYTGVEPGYFETAEAGGYGAATEATVAEGISKEDQDYYRELTEEE